MAIKEVTVKVYEFDDLPTNKAKEKARQWFRECRDDSDFDHVIEMFRELGVMLGFEFGTRAVALMNGKTRQEPKIFYSLGYVQGDGANFDAVWRMADVKLEKLRDEWPVVPDNSTNKRVHELANEVEGIITRLKAANVAEARIDIDASSRYFTMDVENAELLDTEGNDIVDALDATVPENATHDERVAILKPAFAVYEEFIDEMKEFARSMATFLYDSIRDEDEYQSADEQVDENIRANEYEFLEDGTRSRF